MDDYDRLGVGRTHGHPGGDPGITDGDVAVMRTPAGSAVILPVAVRRLRGEALEVASHIQATANEIGRLQEQLAQAVDDGRGVGLSWGVIGWSVGTSGEAARQRWGVER